MPGGHTSADIRSRYAPTFSPGQPQFDTHARAAGYFRGKPKRTATHIRALLSSGAINPPTPSDLPPHFFSPGHGTYDTQGDRRRVFLRGPIAGRHPLIKRPLVPTRP